MLVLVGTAGTATAQWDPTTGRIKPTAGVPVFDPAPWNSGYKVTFCNVPRTNSTGGGAVWPFAPVDDVNTLQECFTSSFDTSPASTVDVVSDTCQGGWQHARGSLLQHAKLTLSSTFASGRLRYAR